MLRRIRRTRQSTVAGDADEDASNQQQTTTTVDRTAGFTSTAPKSTTQVLVTSLDPVAALEAAQSEITTTSIYLKSIPNVDTPIAKAFLALLRGDNRSWEAIAVDILRQKARWESITMADCQGQQLDLLVSMVLQLDHTAYLHLSNMVLSTHAAWSLQSMAFCKSLTKLQLDLIDLSSSVQALSAGLAHNQSLTCLIASRCGLKDNDIAQLVAQGLPMGLQELRIFGNKCRTKGLAALAAILSSTSRTLHVLDVSYQHVVANEENSFDISWVAAALCSNTTLRVLDLDNCAIDDDQLAHLCNMLTQNTTLEELMLNHNQITATGIALLAAKYGEMKGLKKISMYSNQFDSAGGGGGGGSSSTANNSANAAAATTANGEAESRKQNPESNGNDRNVQDEEQ